MDLIAESEGDDLYYCRVDTFRATKDYLQGGLCVRLLGIEAVARKAIGGEEGFETFIIDIDLWKFARLLHNRSPNRETRYFIYHFEDDPERLGQWYKLRIKKSRHELNYFYRTFSDEDPSFFKIEYIKEVGEINLDGKRSKLAAALALKKELPIGDWFREDKKTNVDTLCLDSAYFGGDFMLESFHVGQGMCSIVHNGVWGMLLDLGAGKPVLRPKYSRLNNDLKVVAKKLKSLSLMISHFDSDHWRILTWDSWLRDKIKYIYVPSGSRSPAFYDKNVKHKVIEIGDVAIKLAHNASLRVHRSIPSRQDSNGDCLVTIFYKDGKVALAPGDYTYRRFSSDGNPGIRNLVNEKFSAVIVPHHGDLESSQDVVSCIPESPAFFSAGTHQAYKHPTDSSISEHKAKQYKVIEDREEENVVRRLLLQ